MALIGFNPSAFTPYPTATKAPASTSPAGTSIVATTPVVATPDPLLTTQTDPATGRPVRTSDVVSTDNVANSNDTTGVSPESNIPEHTDTDKAKAEAELNSNIATKRQMYLEMVGSGKLKPGSYTTTVTGSYEIPGKNQIIKASANVTFYCTQTSVSATQNGTTSFVTLGSWD